jgi:hypothetical protein
MDVAQLPGILDRLRDLEPPLGDRAGGPVQAPRPQRRTRSVQTRGCEVEPSEAERHVRGSPGVLRRRFVFGLADLAPLPERVRHEGARQQ